MPNKERSICKYGGNKKTGDGIHTDLHQIYGN
jgi:hypothetical protein